MKFLHQLFVFIVLLISTLESSQNNDTKIHEILKNVGKRYNHYRMMRRDPIVKLNVRVVKFQDRSAEEIEKFKRDQSILIGEFLVQQQALTERSSEVADKLGRMLHPTLVATVCGTDRKLNYYQFRDYLFQQRKQYVQSAYNITPIFNFYETGQAKLHFSMRFTQKGMLGTVSSIEYEVEANVLPVDDESDLDYAVTKVLIGGSCAMKGAVRGPDETFQDRMKKRPEVIQLFSQVIRSDVAHLIESKDWVPMLWMDSLETSNDGFMAMMCSPDKEKPTEITDAATFRHWWHKFSMMWRPYLIDNEYITGQVVRYVPNEEMVTRFTMKLELGRSNVTDDLMTEKWQAALNDTVHDWELMLRSEYNKKGDGLWYITKVDFACPSTIQIPMVFYHMAPMMWITAMIESGKKNDTVGWPDRFMALEEFMGKSPELIYCDEAPYYDLGSFISNLWQKQVANNATLEMFVVQENRRNYFYHWPEEDHKNRITMWLVWKADEAIQTDPDDPILHYSQMHVHFKFNPSLIFYEITGMSLFCLKTDKKSSIRCQDMTQRCNINFIRLGK